MSDSRFLIEVRITHRNPLEADAQTIADLAARGITSALDANDHELLATATGTSGTTEPVWTDGYGHGFIDGKLVILSVAEDTLPPAFRLHRAVMAELTKERINTVAGVTDMYQRVGEAMASIAPVSRRWR